MKASSNVVQPIDIVILNQSLSVKQNQKVRKAIDKRELAPAPTIFVLLGVMLKDCHLPWSTDFVTNPFSTRRHIGYSLQDYGREVETGFLV